MCNYEFGARRLQERQEAFDELHRSHPARGTPAIAYAEADLRDRLGRSAQEERERAWRSTKSTFNY